MKLSKKNKILYVVFLLLLALLILGFFIYNNASKPAQNLVKGETMHINYNTDVTDVGNGKYNYKFYVGPVNYVNNSGNFEPIDTTLHFNAESGAWEQLKASYHISIPEYADGLVDFYNVYEEANQSIKFRPVAEHVKGELQAGGKSVLYHDAFGIGVDFKAEALKEGVRKLIVINDKPEIIKDLTFDFELQLPENVEVFDENNNKWTSDRLDFTGKALKIGSNGKFSYLPKAVMWDSSKVLNSQNVKIELYRKDSKIYLRKTIPAEFLGKAIFPVYTDDTANYAASSYSGYVLNSAADFSGARSGSGSFTAGSGDWNFPAGVEQSIGTYCTIYRGYFAIDTSSIADGATVTDGTLYIGIAPGPAGSFVVDLVDASQAIHTLDSSDWNNIGSISQSDVSVSYGDYQLAYAPFLLNSDGISNVSKTGYTKFGLRSTADLANSDPGNGYNFDTFVNYQGFQSDYGGAVGIGDYPAYLSVTTTGGAPPTAALSVKGNFRIKGTMRIK